MFEVINAESMITSTLRNVWRALFGIIEYLCPPVTSPVGPPDQAASVKVASLQSDNYNQPLL